jgi:hypothetical protein
MFAVDDVGQRWEARLVGLYAWNRCRLGQRSGNSKVEALPK